LDIVTHGFKVGVRFNVVAGDAAKVSVQPSHAPQVGGLDKRPVVVPILAAFGERQSDIAVARAE
jgi:hypothetical protein